MSRAQLTSTVEQNTGGAVARFVAGKNKIINGDFGIWQRGTSFTLTGTAYTYTADRWDALSISGATTTVSQQTFTPGTAPVAGYEGTFFLRYATTDTSVGHILRQHIEDVRTFAGQSVVVSFWAKVASGTPAISMNLVQNFGTSGSSDVGTAVTFTSTALSTGWQRFVGTATIPSVAGKTIGVNSQLLFPIQVSAGNNTVDFWGCQIEAGSVATPFTTATGTLSGELAACQRYYWRAGGDSVYQPYAVGAAQSTTTAQFSVQNPVPMRIAPTSIDFSTVAVTDTINAYSISAITFANAGRYASTVNTAASSLTTFRPYIFVSNNSTSGYFGLSAEL